MSIQPIDLQTLFSHLNQVGKEQANIRTQDALQQAHQGSELARQTEIKDHSVNETKDSEQGPGAIKDEENKNKRHPQEKDQKQERKNENNDLEYVKDPALGNNIDISG